ncbi:hypothetical protein G5714_002152 [Onychostoma macrolepis]|uniref:Chemokine interleukin-8-like domain-containing protein n=1 Tax=Onychostoma macrolepis TaxID=369639 RepID=A0A7J6DED0_9TELE|nr:hypothetical protein G5714_002152 [Onychostoma macrolepis]
MKFTLFAAFLFSIEWMSVAFAVDGPPTDCCNTVSKKIISAENIVKYDKQNALLCPVTAVRFHTKKNKVICSDPESNWAKKVMKIVDGRPTAKPTCYTSTTNVIPITTTTEETSGTETEISTSTTVTPAVTTIKTSETETSTSTTVTPAVTTIKTSETETSTSTTVTPAVTTIKTSETETSTSTTVTPAVTTIKTSETETSTSTIVPTTVTTIKTSTPETEISKTTILPTSVSTDNPESTAITCGTDIAEGSQDRPSPAPVTWPRPALPSLAADDVPEGLWISAPTSS